MKKKFEGVTRRLNKVPQLRKIKKNKWVKKSCVKGVQRDFKGLKVIIDDCKVERDSTRFQRDKRSTKIKREQKETQKDFFQKRILKDWKNAQRFLLNVRWIVADW